MKKIIIIVLIICMGFVVYIKTTHKNKVIDTRGMPFIFYDGYNRILRYDNGDIEIISTDEMPRVMMPKLKKIIKELEDRERLSFNKKKALFNFRKALEIYEEIIISEKNNAINKTIKFGDVIRL